MGTRVDLTLVGPGVNCMSASFQFGLLSTGVLYASQNLHLCHRCRRVLSGADIANAHGFPYRHGVSLFFYGVGALLMDPRVTSTSYHEACDPFLLFSSQFSSLFVSVLAACRGGGRADDNRDLQNEKCRCRSSSAAASRANAQVPKQGASIALRRRPAPR